MTLQTFDQFRRRLPFDVSRETGEKLEAYAALLRLWQPKINLVSPKTIPDLWERHMLDSAQLFPLTQQGARLADFGSGAGFPALVLAILGQADVHVVESDQRKCIFMREVARETATKITVHNERAEILAPLSADIITARALAPLAELLPFAYRHKQQGGKAVFLKGAEWQQEVQDAQQAGWLFHVKHTPSLTAAGAMMLEITDITQGE